MGFAPVGRCQDWVRWLARSVGLIRRPAVCPPSRASPDGVRGGGSGSAGGPYRCETHSRVEDLGVAATWSATRVARLLQGRREYRAGKTTPSILAMGAGSTSRKHLVTRSARSARPEVPQPRAGNGVPRYPAVRRPSVNWSTAPFVHEG